MNDDFVLTHFATCKVWATGSCSGCDCQMPPWRIRKEPAELFAWRIFRFTSDGYVRLMGCSSFEAARQLVIQLMWMRDHALKREADV